MERSEPALVPEWLRGTVGGTSSYHFASSSLHSALSTRNRSSRSISDKDSPRSAFLGRTSSSNSRHSSSSNGSTKHPYSSFARSHHDKNRDKEKDRLVDLWDHDGSDPLEKILTSRVEKSSLRRSQSLISREPGGNNNQVGGNGVHSRDGVVSGNQKAAFEKDFPFFVIEEKQRVPDIGRVSSTGLSTAVQSLPIGNSGLIVSERWTSALAEVPTIMGAAGMGHSSGQPNVVSTPASGTSSAMTGLNMAEALSQAPSHARTISLLPDKTQRLEELAIKQSRQLIPMTPSIPKALALNSSDKSKQPKTAVRTSEMTLTAKTAQQQLYSSQLSNQSPRGIQIRSDAPKTSHVGKFLVLKPIWENGVSSTAKDASSPTNNFSSRMANCQPVVASTASVAPLTRSNNSKLSSLERKVAALALNARSTGEKRSFLSQAQSRSDFFNLMRKKTSVNPSAILQDSSPAVSSPTVEKSGEVIKEAISAPVSPLATENDREVASNGDGHEEVKRSSDVGEKNLCVNGTVYPDEEEAAFLRSLGWEENAGEDEGLTEEEINVFYQEYMKSRPSLKSVSRHPAKVFDAV